MRHRPVSMSSSSRHSSIRPLPLTAWIMVMRPVPGTGTASERWSYPSREKVCFVTFAVFPAVNLPLVPLVGKVDPAQPVCHDATMVFGAPSIFRQGPVFHILTGAPVGEFNPCGVGGIAHPEGMVSPAQGPGGPSYPMGDGSNQLRVAGFLLSNARPIVPLPAALDAA